MIYTCGANVLTRRDLRKIPVPKREDTGSNWKGVQHGVLADTLVTYVNKIGLRIAKETWYTNPNQMCLYGALDIEVGSSEYKLEIGQPAYYSIGVRHDNGGRFAVSLAMGARVLVCSNGVFSGDYLLKSRHYSDLDLGKMIEDGVEEWLTETPSLDLFIRGLQQTNLDERDVFHLVGEAGDMVNGVENKYGCICWAHLQKVLKMWKHPVHKEFEPRTAWSLYNCFTEVGKDLSPPHQMRLLKGLRKMNTEILQLETLELN